MGRMSLVSSAQLSVEINFDRICTRISVTGHDWVDASVAIASAMDGALAGHPEVVVVDLSRFPNPSRHTLATLLHLRGLADRSDSRLEIVGLATASGSPPGPLEGSELRDGPADQPSPVESQPTRRLMP